MPNTVIERASRATARSRDLTSPRTTKRPKPSRGMAVFGTSSQFKGIGRGRRGDPRNGNRPAFKGPKI